MTAAVVADAGKMATSLIPPACWIEASYAGDTYQQPVQSHALNRLIVTTLTTGFKESLPCRSQLDG